MQTTEQLFQQIQNLPEKEKQKLFFLIRQHRETQEDDDKWERARQAIHQVAGTMDLGEQLVDSLDRETIYEERFE